MYFSMNEPWRYSKWVKSAFKRQMLYSLMKLLNGQIHRQIVDGCCLWAWRNGELAFNEHTISVRKVLKKLLEMNGCDGSARTLNVNVCIWDGYSDKYYIICMYILPK